MYFELELEFIFSDKEMIPSFTEFKMDGCFISRYDDTLHFDSYTDTALCYAKFDQCPKGYSLGYSLERYEMKHNSPCRNDRLEINGERYCRGSQPPMNGTLMTKEKPNGKVFFTSNEYGSEEYGFKLTLTCQDCLLDCGVGFCAVIDNRQQCKCLEGATNQNSDPLLPCECNNYDCGDGGTCVSDINGQTYSCKCDQGYYNFRNKSTLPCVTDLIPSFTEIAMNECSLSGINDHLIYSTENRHNIMANCSTEFKCPAQYDVVYILTQFGVAQSDECESDWLKFNNQKYCNVNNEPLMRAKLSKDTGLVSFSSPNYHENDAGFTMTLKCTSDKCFHGTYCGNGDCKDTTERRHECHCYPGYVNRNNDITQPCENVDECQDIDQKCQNGECIDELGDYICNCYEGFNNVGGGKRSDNLDSTCAPVCAKLSDGCNVEDDLLSVFLSSDASFSVPNFNYEEIKCIEVMPTCKLKWWPRSRANEQYFLEGNFEGQQPANKKWAPRGYPQYRIIPNTSSFQCHCSLQNPVLSKYGKLFQRFLVYMGINITSVFNSEQFIARFELSEYEEGNIIKNMQNLIAGNYGSDIYGSGSQAVYGFNGMELTSHEHFNLLETMLALYQISGWDIKAGMGIGDLLHQKGVFPWYQSRMRIFEGYLLVDLLDNIPSNSLIEDPELLFNALSLRITPCLGYGAKIVKLNGDCSCTFAYRQQYNSCYCPERGTSNY